MDPARKHPHHFHFRQSHRCPLFTSFISLVVFLFLLIVVLSLSPHVHGTQDVPRDGEDALQDFEQRSSDEDHDIVNHDMIEDRMDNAKKKATVKVPTPKVKRVVKARTPQLPKPTKPAKVSKTRSGYELMSQEEIRELFALMDTIPEERVVKKRRSPKVNDMLMISRRGSGLRQQRPRKPRDPNASSR